MPPRATRAARKAIAAQADLDAAAGQARADAAARAAADAAALGAANAAALAAAAAAERANADALAQRAAAAALAVDGNARPAAGDNANPAGGGDDGPGAEGNAVPAAEDNGGEAAEDNPAAADNQVNDAANAPVLGLEGAGALGPEDVADPNPAGAADPNPENVLDPGPVNVAQASAAAVQADGRGGGDATVIKALVIADIVLTQLDPHRVQLRRDTPAPLTPAGYMQIATTLVNAVLTESEIQLPQDTPPLDEDLNNVVTLLQLIAGTFAHIFRSKKPGRRPAILGLADMMAPLALPDQTALTSAQLMVSQLADMINRPPPMPEAPVAA